MKVLITGGTGFIGQHVVRLLLSEGHEPVTLSRRQPQDSACRHISLDIDSTEIHGIVREFDAVVHLAGIADASSSYNDPLLYSRINSFGALNVLEGCRERRTRFILASSQRVYEPAIEPLSEDTIPSPQDPYGFSKIVAEQWTQMYFEHFSVPAVVLRFFSVYGPGLLIERGTSGVVSIFLQTALKSEPIGIDNRQLRDFTYVDDVATGILKALLNPNAAGKTYNIATGKGISLEELARISLEVTGSASQVILRGNAGEGKNYIADISKAKLELGFQARVDLKEGLTKYAQWLKERCKSSAEMPCDRPSA